MIIYSVIWSEYPTSFLFFFCMKIFHPVNNNKYPKKWRNEFQSVKCSLRLKNRPVLGCCIYDIAVTLYYRNAIVMTLIIHHLLSKRSEMTGKHNLILTTTVDLGPGRFHHLWWLPTHCATVNQNLYLAPNLKVKDSQIKYMTMQLKRLEEKFWRDCTIHICVHIRYIHITFTFK